jgi:glycosyltransferase involved in cell wall biosynthesis
MRLFINSLAASAGGGLTYIRNVLPRLAKETDLHLTVALTPTLRDEFRGLSEVEFVEFAGPAARRFWHEQSRLPAVVRKSRSQILLSTGNFALRRSPVPQILLSRNSIYSSPDYYSDLLKRHEFRLWLATRASSLLARESVRWADITIAPSQAFAEELRRWTGRPVQAIYHGFDREEFLRDQDPLNSEVEKKLALTTSAVRLLFVSHYNYYRNFETLIRALPFIRQSMKGRPVKLFLTCRLVPGANPGYYNPQTASDLIKQLGVEDMVVELGAIPYRQLHHLYRQCHVYVTAAYAETFAHPLVEAMASGLPVVASDIPVHREICADAGIYFDRFSPEQFAERFTEVAGSPTMAEALSADGQARSRDFSWKVHVDQLLELARRLIAPDTSF